MQRLARPGLGGDDADAAQSAAELAVFRAPRTDPITAASFNPIAPLPLRFSPQNYAAATDSARDE